MGSNADYTKDRALGDGGDLDAVGIVSRPSISSGLRTGVFYRYQVERFPVTTQATVTVALQGEKKVSFPAQTPVSTAQELKEVGDKVRMYEEEIMTNDDNLKSNLLTSSLLKMLVQVVLFTAWWQEMN